MKNFSASPLASGGVWERVHHRYGMAGEGHAAVIEQYLRGRVLYVGCGAVCAPGDRKIENLAERAHDLVVIDVRDAAIREAEAAYTELSNVTFRVADARNLSDFETKSFDSVLALGLFAHIPLTDVPAVFREFWRVCRRGGAVLMTNSTRHPKEPFLNEASALGFELRVDKEAKCTASTTGRRYLLAFTKPQEQPMVS